MSAMTNATTLVKLHHTVVAVQFTTAPASAMPYVKRKWMARLVLFFTAGNQNDGENCISFQCW